MSRRRSLRPDEVELWQAVARTARPMHLAPRLLTDVAPEGPDGLFDEADVDRLIAVVHDVRQRAEAG